MTKPTIPNSNLRNFLVNPSFSRLLETSWEKAGFYRDADTGEAAVAGTLQYLLLYHLYLALLGDANSLHRERAEKLAKHIAGCVREDGILQEPEGSTSDHPANACHVADGLGSFCHYGKQLGWEEESLSAAREALVRIVERHPVVRLPGGILGRSQQMRFELRAYYWAWRVTGREPYREACFALWQNGIHAYQNPIADHGGLLQPSLHPDWTWNYACSSGTTTEVATNTHTPVYYCTEAQGFAFVYHHGFKDGVFQANPEWDGFCKNYFLGLIRNLSRAGHTASDVDGYGIHRAWFGGCLVESSPVEAAGVGVAVGLEAEKCGWFRWYVDRYVDFIRRSPVFSQTGLVEHCPYGHNITIEKQFPPLLGARFYAHLARALYEYRLDQIEPVEPPALASYAWWHNWLRLTTPTYETSFVGTTSLRNIHKVRYYGDPNLGCIHGGAPLATLFVGDRLMYATSNDPAGLWHVELQDFNGQTFRSASTSFQDETAMTVKSSDGMMLSRDCFDNLSEPLNLPIGAEATEMQWAKNLAPSGIRFFVHNAYGPQSFSSKWGASFPAGLFVQSAAFLIAIPASMAPEILLRGEWRPLAEDWQESGWPEAVRWTKKSSRVCVILTPDKPGAAGRTIVRPVPVEDKRPGGENSFCPFPLLQIRLEIAVAPESARAMLACDFQFEQL